MILNDREVMTVTLSDRRAEVYAADMEKSLAQAQKIRRLAAQQLMPVNPALARIVVLEATTAEARALVGLNRIPEALALLRALPAVSPAEIAIRIRQLAGV